MRTGTLGSLQRTLFGQWVRNSKEIFKEIHNLAGSVQGKLGLRNVRRRSVDGNRDAFLGLAVDVVVIADYKGDQICTHFDGFVKIVSKLRMKSGLLIKRSKLQWERTNPVPM